MSEPASPDNTLTEDTPPQPAAPSGRSPLRRLGCGCALLIWFLVLLSPCFIIVLATQGQITISQGDLPGQEVRIWLVQEANERGVGISSTSSYDHSNGEICVQTVVTYVLWQGLGEPATYCDCYERVGEDSDWSLVSTTPGACAPS